MPNPNELPTVPAPETAQEGDQVMQDALAHRRQAQEAIDQARRNIAEGTAVHTSSNGVVETPRESAAIANGETDALK